MLLSRAEIDGRAVAGPSLDMPPEELRDARNARERIGNQESSASLMPILTYA